MKKKSFGAVLTAVLFILSTAIITSCKKNTKTDTNPASGGGVILNTTGPLAPILYLVGTGAIAYNSNAPTVRVNGIIQPNSSGNYPLSNLGATTNYLFEALDATNTVIAVKLVAVVVTNPEAAFLVYVRPGNQGRWIFKSGRIFNGTNWSPTTTPVSGSYQKQYFAGTSKGGTANYYNIFGSSMGYDDWEVSGSTLKEGYIDYAVLYPNDTTLITSHSNLAGQLFEYTYVQR